VCVEQIAQKLNFLLSSFKVKSLAHPGPKENPPIYPEISTQQKVQFVLHTNHMIKYVR